MIQVGLRTGGTLDIYDDGCIDAFQVMPETLAYGLAHVTRFGGQAGAFSVGEHSVNMVRLLKAQRLYPTKSMVRACLIHDAPECLGVGDTQRFVKRRFQSPKLTEFDHDLTLVLWQNLCPDCDPWHHLTCGLKNLDVTIGAIEARHFGFPHDARDLPYFRIPAEAQPRMLHPQQVVTEWMNLWNGGSGGAG